MKTKKNSISIFVLGNHTLLHSGKSQKIEELPTYESAKREYRVCKASRYGAMPNDIKKAIIHSLKKRMVKVSGHSGVIALPVACIGRTYERYLNPKTGVITLVPAVTELPRQNSDANSTD